VPDDPTARFEALLRRHGAELPVGEASLLIAEHAMPGLDVPAQLARLDDLAAGVDEPSVDGLRSHLVDRLGFRGDVDSYHDVRNSLLPEVLDRRMGMPLTLAIVGMEVGRRVGVELVGVGMPGHFLLGVGRPDARYLDLYHGGAVLDPDACRVIFARLHPEEAWDDAFLEPVGPVTIITRLLANLGASYRRSGDRDGLAWALDLRLRLPGATDRERRELALVLGAAGRYDEAADALEGTGAERDHRAAARMRARLN
jgi:regulator of sirC expression with transglutaminase-like and TPR domain